MTLTVKHNAICEDNRVYFYSRWLDGRTQASIKLALRVILYFNLEPKQMCLGKIQMTKIGGACVLQNCVLLKDLFLYGNAHFLFLGEASSHGDL